MKILLVILTLCSICSADDDISVDIIDNKIYIEINELERVYPIGRGDLRDPDRLINDVLNDIRNEVNDDLKDIK